MNAPLKEVKKMEKLLRGSFDVVLDTKSNTSVSHWKDNKMVTIASTFVGARPLVKATRYNRAESRKIEIDQLPMIHVYNKKMGGGVDQLDQTVTCYVTNIRSKKWWWPVFRFCFDVAVNKTFQLQKAQSCSSSQFTTLDYLGFWREIAAVYLSSTVVIYAARYRVI